VIPYSSAEITDVLEKHIASIFRVEKKAVQVIAISETSCRISLEEGCLHFFHEASLYHPSDGAVHTQLKWGCCWYSV
jgi:hypothetical protein